MIVSGDIKFFLLAGTPRGNQQDSSTKVFNKKDENLIESKKMETITTPKETKKVLIPLRRSGIRSKILAKKQLRQGQHFLEYSSDEEAEKAKAAEKNTEAARKGGRGGKRRSNEECHYCGLADADTPMAICSVEKCRKGFCESCIYENFQQDFTFKNYNPECWVCYRCAGLCKCSKCSRKRMTGFKMMNDDFLNSVDFKRGQNKPIAKRRPKYYDPITDDENAIHFHDEQSEQEQEEEEEERETTDNREISENDAPEDSGFFQKLMNKRKRLNKGSQIIDSSQIISEINIDSGIIEFLSEFNDT